MCRLPALYQPNTNNDTICEDVRCLAPVVRLVLRLANELLLHCLRALDLDDQRCDQGRNGVVYGIVAP